MTYKGKQVLLGKYDIYQNWVKELHTIQYVSLDPFKVVFENGVELPWEYSEEEFKIFLESQSYPKLQDELTNFLKGKEIYISPSWVKILGVDLIKQRLLLDGCEKDLYFLPDARIRDLISK